MSASEESTSGGEGRATRSLPSWFVAPVSPATLQRTLFPRPLSDVLAELQVSVDDLRRWHESGWTSFGPDRTDPLEDWDSNEMLFVRDVVRSGLSDAMIAGHFEQIPRPMNFNPHTVAYSFSLGWVMARIEPEPDPNEVVDEHLEQWLIELAAADDRGRLEEIQDQIQGLLSAMSNVESSDAR